MDREFLFRNNLKEDAHRVTSLFENNIQNKAVSNEGLSASIKNSNSLTTTKMILSTPTTETTLPIPEYNTRFTTAKTKTASSSTKRPTYFLSHKTPKVSFFYLEDIYAPTTRNYLLASKYAKTTTPHYLSGKFHFKDYIDMTEFWSDKYDERKTFKNDFDDFYENY
jgi:hypothetical protein